MRGTLLCLSELFYSSLALLSQMQGLILWTGEKRDIGKGKGWQLSNSPDSIGQSWYLCLASPFGRFLGERSK